MFGKPEGQLLLDSAVSLIKRRLEKGEVAESEPVSDNVIIDLDEKGRVLALKSWSQPLDLKKFPHAKVLAK